MSLELQQILGCTQTEEKNQCVILHLAAGLCQSESGVRRSPLPVSRVMHVAKVRRSLGAQQALDITNVLPVVESRWGDELLGLRRDILQESRDRDCRSLRVFFVGALSPKSIRVRVFDVNHMAAKESRLRLIVFNMECFVDHSGETIDIISANGHMRRLPRSPRNNNVVRKEWGDLFKNRVRFYTVSGKRGGIGSEEQGDRVRLMGRNSSKQKCEAAMAPSAFYCLDTGRR